MQTMQASDRIMSHIRQRAGHPATQTRPPAPDRPTIKQPGAAEVVAFIKHQAGNSARAAAPAQTNTRPILATRAYF